MTKVVCLHGGRSRTVEASVCDTDDSGFNSHRSPYLHCCKPVGNAAYRTQAMAIPQKSPHFAAGHLREGDKRMTVEFATDANDLANETGGQLRAKLEDALRRAKAAEEALANAQDEQKKRDVAKTWEDLKVPPKFQAAYLGESNPDAITKWWGEISPLVNLEGPDVAQQPAETAEQREQRDMIEATQRAASLGGDFTSDVEAGFSYARELRERNAPISKAELDDMFSKLGVPK